ncbi:hypothetical protein BABINDRAFT_172218 [Babjeviella inositovora NRRL Y-12698]|uniref:Uncharacterized protein n=1 Tax=Babjeviella inositovora NRRL Y-12698 TaxID=984486 RepID=A0A1E3QLC4_9ASCO|nr:uncharacterized protein BABINDRAFT_172218 [Babjeviella inositovora NRRL Y-12698]ODQ78418.1 hypothetical protein BABINDRAFT_172218 [Babjeviella inositovora NRRL Y-12698]
MKPIVAPGKAYFCTGLSAFGIVILSFIGWLFKINHESMMGSVSDPENGAEVAATVWGAAFIYLLFFVFCGLQIFFIKRQSRIQL